MIKELGPIVKLAPLASGDEFSVTLSKFFRCVHLSYALTQACVQGLTLTGLIKTWDNGHPHFDIEKLYVCISRSMWSAFTIVV